MDVAYSWKQTEGRGRKEDETLQSNGVPEKGWITWMLPIAGKPVT